jgi:hypothetical protein
MVAHHDAKSASWRTSNSNGQYLSTDKIDQTFPDAHIHYNEVRFPVDGPRANP